MTGSTVVFVTCSGYPHPAHETGQRRARRSALGRLTSPIVAGLPFAPRAVKGRRDTPAVLRLRRPLTAPPRGGARARRPAAPARERRTRCSGLLRPPRNTTAVDPDLIGPVRLFVLPLELTDPVLTVTRAARTGAGVDLRLLHPNPEFSWFPPIFLAVSTAFHSDGYLPWCSSTIRAARSRTSTGYGRRPGARCGALLRRQEPAPSARPRRPEEGNGGTSASPPRHRCGSVRRGYRTPPQEPGILTSVKDFLDALTRWTANWNATRSPSSSTGLPRIPSPRSADEGPHSPESLWHGTTRIAEPRRVIAPLKNWES